MSLRRSVIVCATALLFSSPLQAQAPRMTGAALLVQACPPLELDVARTQAAIELELLAQQIELRPLSEVRAREELVVELELNCGSAAPIVVRAQLGAWRSERKLSLEDLSARDRARGLALAVGELVASVLSAKATQSEPAQSDADPEAHPPSADSTPEQPAQAPPSADSTSEEPTQAPLSPRIAAPQANLRPTPRSKTSAARAKYRWQISAAPELRWFIQGELLYGAHARTEYRHIEAGVAALFGSANTRVGSVSAQLIQATAGFQAFNWSLSNALFQLGPRLGFGLLNVAGHALPGVSVDGQLLELYVDAAVSGSASLRLPPFALGIRAEIGAAHGVRAKVDDHTAARWGDALVGGSVYLAVLP